MNKSELLKTTIAPEKRKNMNFSSIHKILLKLHLFLYSAVMALLILIWALIGDISFFLPAFPMLGWGIGIGFHLIAYLLYFNKVSYLTKIKEQSTIGVLFIFHAFTFVMVNLIILCSDLITPGVVFFYWPLSMWGLGLVFHAIGFFTRNLLIVKQEAKLKRKHPAFEERKIKAICTSKLSNLWILITHITYFVIINILLYTVIPNLFNLELQNTYITIGTISWSTILAVHILSFFFYYYVKTIKPIFKGLMIHLFLYIASNILLIYRWSEYNESYFWPIYSLILWGAIIGVHSFISIRYDSLMKSALIKVEKHFTDVDKYKLHSKAKRLLLWKYSFISHLIIYMIGILLITISMISYNVDLRYIIHPIMGWGIGVSVHGAIYLNVYLKIKGFWKWAFKLHLAAYSSTNIYLVILNLMIGGFLWSAIAIVGWGIGLGVHIILAYVR